jgi:iron complex transport system ATP-binding protein
MATHDINLAARFCEKIILLMNDGEYLAGNRQQVLTEENLSEAYNCSIRSITERGITLFYPV